MASTHEYCFCTICGVILDWLPPAFGPSPWDSSLWMSNAMIISGPYWSSSDSPPPSLHVPDDLITRRLAVATDRTTELTVIPNGETITPQLQWDPADRIVSFGIHVACDAMAARVMETSPTAGIRSLGHLWMTLERRCARTERDKHFSGESFLPDIPEDRSTEPPTLGLGRYYVPPECFKEDPPEGWWEWDPIVIPDMTAKLLSNLEQVDDSSSSLATKLASLPLEMRDQINSLVLRAPISMGCNYQMPQAYWKEVFLRIPFLWDLDQDVVASKLSTDLAGKEWNWEKITRQVLSPPKMATLNEDEDDHEAWDYKETGLLVPDGLTNRRRVWQICEDMYPDDVGMVHGIHVPYRCCGNHGSSR